MRARRHRLRSQFEDEQAIPPGADSAVPARDLAARLVAESRGDTGSIADRLAGADQTSQARTLRSLQREHGNSLVEQVVRQLAIRNVTAGTSRAGGSGAGHGRGETLTLEREVGDDEEADVPEAMDEGADIPVGTTEEVGPPTSSSYSVAAVSLSDVASQLASRDEAGYCGWKESWSYKTSSTGRINAVKVKVAIDIEMPAWTPPPSMLPRTKAEWERAYAALLAHEQGHERIVHEHFDGLADKILGKTVRQGNALFNTAKANLRAASRAYDGKTGNGTKNGTVIDTTIEQRELDEKKKADDEKRKAGRKSEAETTEPAETPA